MPHWNNPSGIYEGPKDFEMLIAEQRAKNAEWDAHDRRAIAREPRYALQTPPGNIVGMGTEKPKLSEADKRDFWNVIRLGKKKK